MRRSFTKYLLLTSAGLFFLFSAFAGTGNTKTSTAQQNNNSGIESITYLNANQSGFIGAAHKDSDKSLNQQNNNIVDLGAHSSLSAKQANYDAHVFKAKSTKVPPANDDICNAIEITVGAAAIVGDNREATVEAGEPTGSCWFDAALDSSVWYYFVASGAGTYNVTTNLSVLINDDTQLALYTSSNGCTGTLTEVACNDDVSGTNFLSDVDYTTFSSDTIWVQVDGWSATSGTFEIQVTFTPAPAGGDAVVLSSIGTGIAGGYTDVPTSQANSNNIGIRVSVDNSGTDSLTGVTVNGTINPGANSVSGSVPVLSVGGTAEITTSTIAASNSTAYTANFTVSSNEPDADTSNNSGSLSFTTAAVGDSVYAREDIVTPTGGIGNTTPIRLGNTFTVNSTDTLSTISVYFNGDPVGKSFEVFVGQLSGTTDIYNSGNISGLSGVGWYTFDMNGLVLTPGTYIIGVNQTQSVNIAVGYSTTYQRPGTVFFGDYGAWSDFQTLPPTLYSTLLIRANFGSPTVTLQGADAALTATPSASGIGFYTQVPQSQANGNNIDFDLVVDNVGTDTLTGINLSGTINPGGSSVNASVTPSLAPGASVAASTNSYTATASTAYTATFNVTSNEADVDTSNNTIAYTFTSASVGDSVYALESSTGGPSVGGIGSTATARLGNVFNVNTTDTVTSITVYLAGDPAGKDFEVFIGDPNGTADIYNSGSITGLSGVGFYTFDVGGVILTPGDYIFGLNQTQTNVNIALGVETLSQIPGVSLFGDYSGWTDLTILAVPAPIRGNLVVRPNFGTVASPTILSAFALTAPANGTVLDVTGAGTQTVNVTWGASTPTPSATVTYEWLLDVQGGNFSNPLATISSGTATNLVLTYQDIDNLLNSLGVLVGDTAFTSWTVRATAPGAALLATVPFDLDLIRSGLTPANSRDFEAYNPGDLIVANDTEWEFWPGATIDAPVSNVQSQSGANSLLIDQAPNQDLVFKLGNQTAGVWGAGFSIYIPSGNGAYYNLQETEVPGIRWPIGNVVFDPAGTGTVDGVSPAANFTFPHDQWFDVRNYVDLDNDSFQVWINNSFVAGGVWTAAPPQGGGTSQLQLGGINIFPEGAGGTSPAQKVFYLDDMYFQPDSLRTPVNYVFSPYNLTSPPDQTRLEVEAGDPTPVVIDWESTTTTPAATPNYVWLLDLIGGTFTNPELSLVSDNGGADSQLSLTSGALDVQLSNLGVAVGDSIDRSWTVEASVAGQTAFPANAPYSIRLVRRSPIGFDPSALENNISFFPNPTSDQLVVKVRDNAVDNVEIQSMLGQTLKSFEINKPTNVLDVSGLSSGLYIIRFVSENQEYSQKLIIE